MDDIDELVLLENDGVKGRYLCTKDNVIVEAVGTVAVPRENKVAKYRGIVKWSQETSLAIQVKAMKKICEVNCNLSNEEMLRMAREKANWVFGEFYIIDAVNIMRVSKKYNLNIEMRDIESGEKLVI